MCPNFAPCYIYPLWSVAGVGIKLSNKRSEINHEDRIMRMSSDMSLTITTAKCRTAPEYLSFNLKYTSFNKPKNAIIQIKGYVVLIRKEAWRDGKKI